MAHLYIFYIVRKGQLSPLFKLYPPPPFCLFPLFSKLCHPPDKQHLFLKNFAFHSSLDTVENVTNLTSTPCNLLFFVQSLGCLLPFQFNPPIDSSKNSYLGSCTEHSLTVVCHDWSSCDSHFLYLPCFFSAAQHPQASILFLL